MTAAALVMAQAPRPGQVRQRLEPLLGVDGCAVLQARLVERAARLAAEVAPEAAFLAVDPPHAVELMGDLVGPGVELVAQARGDPGERLSAATELVFARRTGPLVVLGVDAPTVGRRQVDAALELLDGGRDVALGPSLDGGYYLIALARPLPDVFALPPDVWGGPRVLGRTLRAVRSGGLRVGLVEPARALDTPDDVEALLEDEELPNEIAALLRSPTAR